MTSLNDAINDLQTIEKDLTQALSELDAMGVHLFCDKSPLTAYINHLVALQEYYEEKVSGEQP